jgi:hypothetical protein
VASLEEDVKTITDLANKHCLPSSSDTPSSLLHETQAGSPPLPARPQHIGDGIFLQRFS